MDHHAQEKLAREMLCFFLNHIAWTLEFAPHSPKEDLTPNRFYRSVVGKRRACLFSVSWFRHRDLVLLRTTETVAIEYKQKCSIVKEAKETHTHHWL